MNALRPVTSGVKKSLAAPMRRFASSQAYFPPLKKWNVKKDWLSDPATYPLILILGCAVTFCTGAGIHALVAYKDVQISPKKRNSMLQTWGADDNGASFLSKAISWNAYSPEGLGIDHKKWLETKKEEPRFN